MIKLLTVVGARPQFIKASIISKTINQDFSNRIKQTLVHTGQHFSDEMSSNIFTDLGLLKPDKYLNINQQSHSVMTANIMLSLNDCVNELMPDCLLVYGDTNSTLAASLVAAQNNIPLIHVESGLRSFNRRMPEEKNRIVSDHLAQLLFAPTDTAYKQLIREGIEEDKVFNSGDVMYDVFCHYKNDLNLKVSNENHVLVTIHREENSSVKKIKKILDLVNDLTINYKVIFPVHPRIKNIILSLKDTYPNINFISPLNYTDLLKILISSSFVVTDSGGLQKEAFFAKKFCITVRNETEWVELVKNGSNYLYDIDNPNASFETIFKSFNADTFESRLYGDGHSSTYILNKTCELLG